MKQLLKEKKYVVITGVSIIYCLGLIAYAWFSSLRTSKDLAGFSFAAPLTIGSIFLICCSILVVWVVYVKKAKIHNIYLIMAVAIFSMFLWAQPAGHAHDIQFHYDSTYVLSNQILNQNTEQIKTGQGGLGSYWRRESDVFIPYTAFEKYIDYYADAQEAMFTNPRAENTALVKSNTYQGTISVPLYFYLPQAIGFAVARLLGLNVFWMLLLGRLCICGTSVWLTWRTIKNAPFAKELFFICGLIPTTILSYASISRDALILAFSFYFTSKCMQIVYNDGTQKWWDYVLLIISLVLLVPYKLVYIPFIFLLTIIMYRNCKYGIWKKKYIGVGALICFVIIGIFITFNFGFIQSYLSGTNSYSMGEGAPFTLPYILDNPGTALKVVVKTIVTSTVRYFANMIAIGDYGGGIHKEMVAVSAFFMAVLILASNKRDSINQKRILPMERCIRVVTWGGISGLIIFAYLLCTPYTNDIIIGVQGRYFTPALPLILLSFWGIGRLKMLENGYWIRITDFFDKEIIKRSILLGMYGLSLFVVVNMYVWMVA